MCVISVRVRSKQIWVSEKWKGGNRDGKSHKSTSLSGKQMRWSFLRFFSIFTFDFEFSWSNTNSYIESQLGVERNLRNLDVLMTCEQFLLNSSSDIDSQRKKNNVKMKIFPIWGGPGVGKWEVRSIDKVNGKKSSNQLEFGIRKT